MRVPVLSEQITSTDPSVSTVGSDLTSTFCFDICFATIVRVIVTAIGRPSGMNATTIPKQVLKIPDVLEKVKRLDYHSEFLLCKIYLKVK